jgi:hypothetical protein
MSYHIALSLGFFHLSDKKQKEELNLLGCTSSTHIHARNTETLLAAVSNACSCGTNRASQLKELNENTF